MEVSKFLKNIRDKKDKDYPNHNLRQDITIRYYEKKNDDSVVYRLKDYGFYIHERESTSGMSEYKSNAVFYGDSVSLDDLKTVCFVLRQGGLPLRAVELSKYHNGWKANAIEIGTDTTVMQRPLLSLEDIMTLTIAD